MKIYNGDNPIPLHHQVDKTVANIGEHLIKQSLTNKLQFKNWITRFSISLLDL
jgi:hypothetical protein